ncbi:MAG: glycosyltransferase family 9 protein [Nitrospirae bacterium]|nr:glycosyltransferase family 9 protein [Nitrospirota bacterium]
MNVTATRRIDYYLGSILIAILKPVVILMGLFLRRKHSLELKGDLTIVKLLGGGSLVIAFPSLLGLRRKYPNLITNLVTTKGTAQFARTLNIFDNILIIDDSGIFRLLGSSLRAYSKIFRCDTIIDLEAHSRLSTVFSLLTCARNRIGFYLEEAFWRRRINTHLIYFNLFSGSYHFYDKIFQLFSVSPLSAEECREHIIKNLPKTAPADKYRICIGHSTSDLGKERILNAEQWKRIFCSRIDEHFSAEVVFLGAPRDFELASAIIKNLRPHFPNLEFINLCGKAALDESLSILSYSDEFWGVDSSLLHYARIFGIRSVSYWGPTDPMTRLREIPGLEEEVYYSKVPCSPCIHVTETPPCMGDNICIQNLFNEKKRAWIGLVN